jgi:hypothetical protein
MKTIKLKPVKITKKLLTRLERRGLITTLKFTAGALKAPGKRGRVDLIYRTGPQYGPQKLICVGKKDQAIEMNVHGDKEELLVFNTTGMKFKPLYLIIAMDKLGVFKGKIRGGKLGQKDIMAIELKYNDPATSVFMMNGGVPHCEVTLPGRGQHPLFFVTEPADLSFEVIDTKDYKLVLSPPHRRVRRGGGICS